MGEFECCQSWHEVVGLRRQKQRRGFRNPGPPKPNCKCFDFNSPILLGAKQLRTIISIVALILAIPTALAGTGQIYSCTLDYSVTAGGGKILDWGSWKSLFGAGPGQTMAKSHGKILIDTSVEALEPVRMFGNPSPFKWKTIQKGGGGNS